MSRRGIPETGVGPKEVSFPFQETRAGYVLHKALNSAPFSPVTVCHSRLDINRSAYAFNASGTKSSRPASSNLATGATVYASIAVAGNPSPKASHESFCPVIGGYGVYVCEEGVGLQLGGANGTEVEGMGEGAVMAGPMSLRA